MAATIYSTALWRIIRLRALKRDGARCTVSRLLGGQCRGSLHVHHIVPLEEGGPAYDLDNLGTSCARHHPKWEALRRSLRRYRDDDPRDFDRERRVRAAVGYLRNVGHLIDDEAELHDCLYGWGGYLREYADDDTLRTWITGLWRERRQGRIPAAA